MLSLLHLITLASLSFSVRPIPLAPTPRLVYQFPPGVFVENIACRSNGHLLLSILSEPVLYSINPTVSSPAPKVVHTFPNVTGMTGIAETTTPDVFAIIGGVWNLTTLSGTLGSFSIWSVDFRSDPPLVAMIAPIPYTDNLNGLATIERSPKIILAADSKLGAVWALDTKSGNSRIAIRDPNFQPGERFPLGINGINTLRDHLYFTNSGRKIYGSIPIHSDGSAAGRSKVLATLDSSEFEAYDDFAMDQEGNALIATHPNSVYQASLRGKQSVHSRSDVFAEPTSSIFGRGSAKEAHTIYVTAGGRTGQSTVWVPTNRTPSQGGQVIAIDNYQPPKQNTCSCWSLLLQVFRR